MRKVQLDLPFAIAELFTIRAFKHIETPGTATVTIRDSLANVYVCWFSHPRSNRELYRCIRRNRVRHIVELGIDTIEKTTRMIRLAAQAAGASNVRYTSIDMFDARPAELPALSLKHAHRQLASTGASIRLIPGDTQSGLVRHAHQLADTDLLILSATLNEDGQRRVWPYVPRMLSKAAHVYEKTSSNPAAPHRLLTRSEIDRLVSTASSTSRVA